MRRDLRPGLGSSSADLDEGVGKTMSQQVTGSSVHKLCGKTLGVSRRTLAIPGKGVVGPARLVNSEADANKCNRIKTTPCSERELLFPSEWGGVAINWLV